MEPWFLHAIVPIVGGLALVADGSTALYVDPVDILADENEPKLV